MATIVVLTHEYDAFDARSYALRAVLGSWREAGHRVLVHAGERDAPAGDVAVVHVDASVLPPAYLEAAAAFPVALNARAVDLRKRAVSPNLLARGEAWAGAVVVKTDLNCAGVPERLHDLESARRGLPQPHGFGPPAPRYFVVPSLGAVPDAVWADRRLVVERFLPERDERGYAVRIWVFLGGRERCNVWHADSPFVKGPTIRDREPCEVPEAMREARARLGLDYGKIDFVLHEGRPVLLDANRTPGAPPASARAAAEAAWLAGGLDGWVARAERGA